MSLQLLVCKVVYPEFSFKSHEYFQESFLLRKNLSKKLMFLLNISKVSISHQHNEQIHEINREFITQNTLFIDFFSFKLTIINFNIKNK
jgi:hypothetical protein